MRMNLLKPCLITALFCFFVWDLVFEPNAVYSKGFGAALGSYAYSGVEFKDDSILYPVNGFKRQITYEAMAAQLAFGAKSDLKQSLRKTIMKVNLKKEARNATQKIKRPIGNLQKYLRSAEKRDAIVSHSDLQCALSKSNFEGRIDDSYKIGAADQIGGTVVEFREDFFGFGKMAQKRRDKLLNWVKSFEAFILSNVPKKEADILSVDLDSFIGLCSDFRLTRKFMRLENEENREIAREIVQKKCNLTMKYVNSNDYKNFMRLLIDLESIWFFDSTIPAYADQIAVLSLAEIYPLRTKSFQSGFKKHFATHLNMIGSQVKDSPLYRMLEKESFSGVRAEGLFAYFLGRGIR